jgi:predicted MFS family arabinose efflux permease
MGAIGVGAMLGALALSVRTPRRQMMLPTIVVTLGVFGAALSGVGYLRWRVTVLVMLAVCGTTMVTCLALCNTSIQQRVPDHMRGRVLSMYTFSFYAFLPFGNLASGAVAERYGIGATLFVLGAAMFIVAAAAAVAVRRRRRGKTIFGDVAVPYIGSDVS